MRDATWLRQAVAVVEAALAEPQGIGACLRARDEEDTRRRALRWRQA